MTTAALTTSIRRFFASALALALLFGGAVFVIAPSTASATVITAGSTLTFSSTGSEQSFVVPTGATTMLVTAVGAPGSASYPISSPANNNAVGGKGAVVTAVVPAPAAGTTVYVEVGGVPTFDQNANSAGGYNGGGTGNNGAGGGGGATDLQTVSDLSGGDVTSSLVLAGGGGGAGAAGADENSLCYEAGCIGGAGGSAVLNSVTGGAGANGPDNGAYYSYNPSYPTFGGGQGGGGGTTTAGGAGGQPNTSPNNGCDVYAVSGGEGGSPGVDGSLGTGGEGSTGNSCSFGNGGGGGGGYYGGGGGAGGNGIQVYASAGGGGGGAGSSYVESAALSSSVAVSSSSTSSLTVTFNPTATAVSCSPSTDPVSESTTCTATVTSDGGVLTPSGTVSFSTDTTKGSLSATTCVLSGGSCSVTYTPLAGTEGQRTISASYGGDSLNAGSSGSGTETTSKIGTTLSASCATSSTVNIAISCSATVTNTDQIATAVASGTVSWSVATGPGTVTPTCTLVAGSCNVTYTPTTGSEGANSLNVSYGGDTDHSASMTTAGTTVAQRTSSVDVSCTNDPSQAGIANTCVASVSDTSLGTSLTPTGTVDWSVATGSGSFSGDSCTLIAGACSVTFTPDLGTEGTSTLSAAYLGNLDHTGSSEQGSFTVSARGSSTQVVCGSASVVVNDTVNCVATVSDASLGTSSTPGGTVSWSVQNGNGSYDNDSCTLSDGSCSVNYTPNTGSEADQTVVADYNGDTDHVASEGTTGLNVTVRTSSVAVDCGTPTTAVNTAVTCTATVTDTSDGTTSTPTGTVDWSLPTGSGTFTPTSCTLSDGSCSTSLTLPLGGEASLDVTANYLGDVDHDLSMSDASLVVGVRSTSVSVQCYMNDIEVLIGTQCIATVNDTDAGTTTTPSGTVSWAVTSGSGSFDNDSCTLSDGSCSVNYVPDSGSEGTQDLTATYVPDADHAASSTPFDLSVGQQPQTLSFTSTPYDDITPGDGVYQPVVTGGGSSEPIVITSATPSVCQYENGFVDAMTNGVCTLDANQAGDTDYVAAAQAQQSFTVYQIAAVAPAPPPAGGSSSTYGEPTSVTSSSTTATTATQETGTTTTAVMVPAGALPAGTTVSVYPVVDATSLMAMVPASSSYVVSVAVSWVAPNGTTPTASAPITITITDPNIKAGDTIYEVTSQGLTAVGTATVDGSVVVTFTTDPTFVVAKSNLVAQSALTLTSTSGTVGTPLSLATSGGSGTGAVSFTTTNGTATGCAVTGDTLSATTTGTCLVTGSKASDANYVGASTPATVVTFVAKVVTAAKSITIHFAKGSATLSTSTKNALIAYVKVLPKGTKLTVESTERGDATLVNRRSAAVAEYLHKRFTGKINLTLRVSKTASGAQLETVTIAR